MLLTIDDYSTLKVENDMYLNLNYIYIFFHNLVFVKVTQEELDVEKGIQSNSGVKTHAIWGSTLVNKADLPFPVSQ